MLLHPTAETPTDIRRRNRFAVLSLLRKYGTLSKSDLVRLTARTNTTIATIMDSLLDEGLVQLADASDQNHGSETARGRPATQYNLTADRWLAAGIQISSDAVTGVIIQLDGSVIASKRVSSGAEMPVEAVLELAAGLIEELLQNTNNQASLLGIGFALEGLVDIEQGVSLSMPYRAMWTNVPIAAHFSQRFNVPVLVDWRVYAAALAEASYGAAREVANFAYLNVDTGVAVACVASGTMMRGNEKPAGITGDLGHVLNTGGPRLCYCGKSGCIQTEITVPALLMQLKEMISFRPWHGTERFWQSHGPTLENLIEAAQEGDALALQLRNRFAQHLSTAITSTILLFSANLIIVGGPMMRFGGEEAIETAQRATQNLTILHSLYGLTRVVASLLQPDSATVGAAALVVQAVMDGRITAPAVSANITQID